MFKQYRAVLAFILLFTSNVNAQVPGITGNDSLRINELDEVEVRAMYSGIVTRRFPATVYALDNDVRGIVLPVNINERLNQIPAVYAHTGTFNTSRITMRGIGTRSLYGTRKINALLNDIPLTSGEGDTFIDDIDMQFISRIEAVGGPTAGIYGPALGGTILMFVNPDEEKNSLRLSSGAGSFGTFQHAVSAGLVKPGWRVSVKFKNVKSDGYRQNNRYNRNSALIVFKSTQKKSELDFLVLFADVAAEIPSSIDSLSFETNPRAAAANWAKTKGREKTGRALAGLTYQYKFSETFSSFTTIYGLYKKSLEVRPFNYLQENDLSGGAKFYFKKKVKNVTGLGLTSGVSAFIEKYSPSLFENIGGVGEKGKRIAKNEENIIQANAFFIAEYVPDFKNHVSLSLNLSKFRLSDQNIFAGSAAQSYNHQVNFSPRVSVSRQLLPNHYFFGSISHGLSYPSVQEILYPDGSINKDVNPEKAWSFEAGLKGIQLLKELKYSLAFYYMPVSDLIVPERIAEDTYIGKNIGQSLHRGVEISMEKSLPLSDRSSWFYLGNYRASFTWQSNKFQDFLQDGINLKGNILPGVPEKRLFAALDFRFKNLFFVQPEIFVNGKTAMNDLNTRFYRAYDVINLKVGFKLDKEKWNLTISTVCNNLFGEKYASMILINAPSANNRPPRFFYPGLPRNYSISVAAGFTI